MYFPWISPAITRGLSNSTRFGYEINIYWLFSISISIYFSVKLTGLIPNSGTSGLILCLTSNRVSIIMFNSLWSTLTFYPFGPAGGRFDGCIPYLESPLDWPLP